MRKITAQAVSAFNNRQEFKGSNTSIQQGVVTSKVHQMQMYLHGNLIATTYWEGRTGLFISNAGWQSNTTKERLNGLPGVRIHQAKGQWYLNGKEWDGDWIEVK